MPSCLAVSFLARLSVCLSRRDSTDLTRPRGGSVRPAGRITRRTTLLRRTCIPYRRHDKDVHRQMASVTQLSLTLPSRPITQLHHYLPSVLLSSDLPTDHRRRRRGRGMGHASLQISGKTCCEHSDRCHVKFGHL